MAADLAAALAAGLAPDFAAAGVADFAGDLAAALAGGLFAALVPGFAGAAGLAGALVAAAFAATLVPASGAGWGAAGVDALLAGVWLRAVAARLAGPAPVVRDAGVCAVVGGFGVVAGDTVTGLRGGLREESAALNSAVGALIPLIIDCGELPRALNVNINREYNDRHSWLQTWRAYRAILGSAMATDDQSAPQHGRRLLALLAYPLLFAAMVVLSILYHEQLWALATAPAELRDWVQGFGVAAPLVFVAVQIIQVVIFIIPGEVPQIASGYLFGIAGGLALTSAGIAIGSGIAFLASRLLGTEFLRAILRGDQVARMRQVAASPRATITFFLFFLVPGIPKDILCYVAGLSRMRFSVFMVISTVGRLPGIVGSVVMGDAAAGQRWLFAGVVMGIAVVLFGIGLLFRQRLTTLLERFAADAGGTDPGNEV